MDKKILCKPWNNTSLILNSNRLSATAYFEDGRGNLADRVFILDTGAIISVMSRNAAEDIHGLYDKDVVNYNAVVGGFYKEKDKTTNEIKGIVKGRVIRVKYLRLARAAVRDTLFFVPDSYEVVSEVLGASVLHGLVPIPDFNAGLIWIWKNESAPAPYISTGLGVTINCEVLPQEEVDISSCGAGK